MEAIGHVERRIGNDPAKIVRSVFQHVFALEIGAFDAFRLGEASLIAPLEYTALVWGVALDLALWGVLPDAITWLGAAIIIASGLYLLRRERVHAEAEHP